MPLKFQKEKSHSRMQNKGIITCNNERKWKYFQINPFLKIKRKRKQKKRKRERNNQSSTSKVFLSVNSKAIVRGILHVEKDYCTQGLGNSRIYEE